jgi:hypothetical protein
MTQKLLTVVKDDVEMVRDDVNACDSQRLYESLRRPVGQRDRQRQEGRS